MAKKTQDVSEYMLALEHPLKAEIDRLRQVVVGANGKIREEIKWNAPSYYIEGNTHFATMNLHRKDAVLLIFHRGTRAAPGGDKRAGISDPSGLLEWLAPDRAMVTFASLKEVTDKQADLTNLINEWMQGMQST